MWSYNYMNDELYHAGVKGMKWGVRKKRFTNGLKDIAGMNYTNKSRASKPTNEKQKGNKKLYDKTADYAKKQSKGKKIAKSILLGHGQHRTTYDMARAHGEGRVKAAARSILDVGFGDLGASAGSILAGAGASKATRNNQNATSAAAALGSRAGNNAMSSYMRNKNKLQSAQQVALAKKYGYRK